MSRETQRTPASSSFISPVLSSLKLTSPKFDLSSFCSSKSVIGPFFSRISTIDSDMGLGLQTLLNAIVTRKVWHRGIFVIGTGARCFFELLLMPLYQLSVYGVTIGRPR